MATKKYSYQEIDFDNADIKGFKLPVVDTFTDDLKGLLVFNNNTGKVHVHNGDEWKTLMYEGDNTNDLYISNSEIIDENNCVNFYFTLRNIQPNTIINFNYIVDDDGNGGFDGIGYTVDDFQDSNIQQIFTINNSETGTNGSKQYPVTSTTGKQSFKFQLCARQPLDSNPNTVQMTFEPIDYNGNIIDSIVLNATEN